MTWQEFPLFFYITSTLWIIGLLLQIPGKRTTIKIISEILIIAGTLTIITFTIFLWINLGRPVFRTLGETRLWYSIFLAIIGIVMYYRWKMRVIIAYCILMANLFIFINLLHPDVFDKTLMPALQSPWFIPHVVVYIIGYAFLAFSSLMGIIGLIQHINKMNTDKTIKIADDVVYIGFAFLTFGLLFGALWAKEAWGHYWTWDPKETWAFITWLVYLLYIHIRIKHKSKTGFSFWTLSFVFVFLLICWFGINYLPSASNSVHVY